MKFSEIISLGYNCEVSFRIKDYCVAHGLDLNSFVFSWAYVQKKEGLLKALPHLDTFWCDISDSGEGLQYLQGGGMYSYLAYDIAFHSKAKKMVFENGKTEEEIRNLIVDEMKSRYTYLSEKLLATLNDESKNVMFIYKMPRWERDIDNNVNFINALIEVLRNISKCKVSLCIVLEKASDDERYRRLECDDLHVRFVEQFADDSETETGGDKLGWSKIFEEFSLDCA